MNEKEREEGMSAISEVVSENQLVPQQDSVMRISREKVELIKRTVAVGATDDELELFLYQAGRLQLDPLSRQIYFIKRKAWDSNSRSYIEKATIQTSIDGLRLIAERTKNYAPGEDIVIREGEGGIVSATAEVKKYVNGQWFSVKATAYYDEYCQRDREGNPIANWRTMPRVMLGKCAEALALRKAFPAQMSGVYAHEEMENVALDAQIVEGDKREERIRQALADGKSEEKKLDPRSPHPLSSRDGAISVAQMWRLNAIARGNGWGEDTLKAYLSMNYRNEKGEFLEHTYDLRRGEEYNKFCEWVETHKPYHKEAE